KLAKLPDGVNSEVQYSCKLDNCIDSIPAFPKEIQEIQNLFKKGKSLDPVLASKFFSCDGRFIEDSSPEAYLSKNSNAAEDILKYKQEFHKLKEEYSRLGVNPLKIKDLIARRFINRNDWEKYLNKKMNTKEAIQPADVYSPAPVTWQNWRNVTDNYIDKKIKEKGEVTLDELVKWNGEALVGTLPSYVKISLKNTNNMGSNVTKATALNDLEIENIQNIKIPGPKDKNSEIKWVYAKCVEDLKFPIKLPNENPDCQAYYNWVKAIEDKDEFGKKVVKQMEKGELVDAPYSFYCWPRDTKDGGFRDGQIKKHCGFLEYPPTESSKESFEKIIHNVNESINGKNQSVDPIKTAIDHQIQVVGLHPFNKGNGRTSRWVMDYITLSNDLPPILINDMNVDLSTPEKAYYLKAKRGVHHSLLIMQRCLELYKKAEKSVKLKEALQKSECGIDEF
ncbi:MAG: Fic family protein, partial [Bacteriovoracaceae bacterium]